MSEQDVDKAVRLIKALDDLVEGAEAILADGKVDFTDAMHMGKFASPLKELYELWGAKDELLAELKDLDWSEVKQLADAAKE